MEEVYVNQPDGFVDPYHPDQPGNINGWVDDDDVEEEDEENEDADIEEDDDAEIIFPYEVQGDQNPPPRDESSDFDSEPEPEAEEADDEPEADDELEVEEAGVEPEAEGADVELEAEEPDGVPEATIRTGSQRPFAVRDFPMDFYETGESYTTRDPQFVGGLAPWALRRDLEALIIEGSGLGLVSLAGPWSKLVGPPGESRLQVAVLGQHSNKKREEPN
nr:hypothetical protein [Tanacetum cinerariifolium]